MKKRITVMLMVVLAILLIFTLTACGEKMPTECPSYIDLSLEREIAAFDKINEPSVPGVKFAEFNKKDFYPDDVYVLEYNSKLQKYVICTSNEINNQKDSWGYVDADKAYKPSEKAFIYITPDNVLYLVLCQMQEIDSVLHKYVTKMAVRDGDKYIYKADNWSGEGIMVAEYCNMYYDFFNIYKEYMGKPTATPPATNEEINVKVPDYIDYSGEKQLLRLDEVMAADFNSVANPLSEAQRFVPEGATVYRATGGAGESKVIIYITADGVCYQEKYADNNTGKNVIIIARKATDHYAYARGTNEEGKVFYLHHARNVETEFKLSTEFFNLWRAERGLNTPIPMGNSPSSIFKGVPRVNNY